jgi:hypothetical protein
MTNYVKSRRLAKLPGRRGRAGFWNAAGSSKLA